MKIKVFVLLLLSAVILIGFYDTFAFVSPCDTLSESECVESYNSGYVSVSTCNTMFYCYPKYISGKYEDCIFVPRTNFSSCDALNSCYNGVVMDTTQSRKCFCDSGVEYMTIDPCGNSGNWSGKCLDMNSCVESERTYLRRIVKDYSCNELSDQKVINCFSLTHEDTRCISGKKLVSSRYYYIPNACGTACVLDNIETLSEKYCECSGDKCLPTKKTVIMNKEIDEVDPIVSPPKVFENFSEKNENISSLVGDYKDVSKTDKESIVSTEKKLDFKIKIRKDISHNVITIMLIFFILFISGMLFLLHNR